MYACPKGNPVFGIQVGQGKIWLLVDEIQALKDYKQPVTNKQIRSFVGLANYYHKVIPHFSEMVVPLTDLTTSNVPHKIKWNPAAPEAFKQIKQALC